MIVLFRSCEANISPGSLGDSTNAKPRWNGKFKGEILRKCYKSIQAGLTRNDTIIIVNDKTSEETLEWMADNTEANFEVVNIQPLAEIIATHKYPDYHPVIANGCEDMMELLVVIAEEHPNEIIYVCEDDYLHQPHAISYIKSLYATEYKGFYIPQDYPDRYSIDRSRACELYIHDNVHLRTIPSATLTMATLGSTWARFKIDLLRAGVFADDSWTYKAFKLVEGVSPVPGHSTHLQENCITPCVNWEAVYNNITI